MLMVGAIVCFYLFGGSNFLTLTFMQQNLAFLREKLHESPVLVTSGYVVLYVILTALSVPGTIVLTLLSAAVFGLPLGTFLVMFCAVSGACIAFLLSRYLFRDYFLRKFAGVFQRMNARVHEDGVSYLFTMRMIPVSPYTLINNVMGLTDMPLFTFAWVTLFGMFPGTFLYIIAGKKIAEIRNISDILSADILLALTAVGLFPMLMKYFLRLKSRRRLHE